jgi:beta-lactamase regulating signal transducer with metallopeptidase domain
MQLIPMADALQAALAAAGSRFVAAFSAFALAAAPVAVVALWQGALIAVALVLCLRFAPRVSAAHRFTAWAAGFAVVVGLPFLPFIAHSSAANVARSLPLRDAAATPWLSLDSRWGFVIAALWLIASALRAADLIFHSLRLRRLWKTATPVEVDSSLRSLLVASHPKRPIEICTTRELDRPSVIGFLAPRILVPDWLFERLTPGEFEHVVLHEAEHLRRHDDWTNLLQKLSLVLFPLNPALAWMERRLCREREMACDEGVVRRTQAPRAYAACLTSLAERELEQRELLRHAHALSLGAFERRPELVRRVHSILWRKQALQPLAARALLAVVGCGLLFGSVELARCPQVVAFVAAQKPDAQTASSAQTQAEPANVARASDVPARELTLERGATPFRAIQTKAFLPARRSTAAPLVPALTRRVAAQPSSAAEREIASRETNAEAPRQVLLKAETAASTSSPLGEQQYIVFAAWEEVRTTSSRSTRVTDYDTSAFGEQAGASAGQPDSEPATRITITRLVLTVYTVNPAPSPKAAHATDSKSGRPTAVPFDNGWLFFQL